MVVEVSCKAGVAVLVARQQSPVDEQVLPNKRGGAGSRSNEFVALQGPPGDREAPDGEGIPRRELLVVPARRHSPRACLEQYPARLVDDGRVLGRLAHGQVPLALEVRRLVQPEVPRELIKGLRAEQFPQLGGIPHVELAFLALGIGVARGIEAAVRVAHVGQQPVGGFLSGLAEQLLSGCEVSLRVRGEQRAVVIQHLLEMRNLPVTVHGVAAEAAAEVIVDAALGHARQRQRRHEQGLDVGFGVPGRRPPGPQQAIDGRRVRELGRAAEAAELAVEAGRKTFAGPGERRCRHGVCRPRGQGLELAEYVCQPFTLLPYLVPSLVVIVRHLAQQVAERGHTVARLIREVGAPEKRALVLGVEEHRQRPATAALGQQLVCRLVDLVHVRSLLAVDLDVDEQLVHQLRRGLVLERLVCHDVAPVAGRVTDRQQHRFALVAGQRKSFLAPGVPVDRVVGVLEQVGTRLGG